MPFARTRNTPTRHRRPSRPQYVRTVSFLALLTAAALATASAPATAAAAGANDAVAGACPCAGPAAGGSWRSHGQYLACVTRAARREAHVSSLRRDEVRAIVRDGGRSTCGARSREEANVQVCAPNPSLPCPIVRTAHVDDCSECSAALAGELVHCARVASASGMQGDVCGTATRIGALGKRAVERRTAVDCNSCKAKLGTPLGEGTDCVAALCDSFAGH